MKRFITLIFLFPMFLMAGCDWFEEADLLEVYFGIRQNITSVDTTTNFYYENEDVLTLNINSQVYIRLDFLYIPRQQEKTEIKIVEFSFEDSENFFLSPVLSPDLEPKNIQSKFIYELPLQKNQYVSYFFSIEVLNPASIQLELNSSILMEQVNTNPLNQSSLTSENTKYEIIKKGLKLSLNTLHFQTNPII